jgi:hypothetical protein
VAEQKAATGASADKAKKPKRKLSPAGRAAIVATLKKTMGGESGVCG